MQYDMPLTPYDTPSSSPSMIMNAPSPSPSYTHQCTLSSSSSPSSLEDTVQPNSSALIATNGQARRGPHIRRPPNAFLLFRSDFLKQGRIPKTVENKQQSLSIIASVLWKRLSEEERGVWKAKAKVVKKMHLLEHPNYVYKPMPKAKKVKDVVEKDPHKQATQLLEKYYPQSGEPTKKSRRPSRKTTSSKSRKTKAVDEVMLPPTLSHTRPASAMEQPGKSATFGGISPGFRSLPTTPSRHPLSHAGSAMEYAYMSALPSSSTRPSSSLSPHTPQPRGYEQSVSRLPALEMSNVETTLPSINYDPSVMASWPYEMSTHNCAPPAIPSLPAMEDTFSSQFGLGGLAPTSAPIYPGSPSAFSDPQAHASMLGLSYLPPQQSSATQQLDLPCGFMPVNGMGDGYGGAFDYSGNYMVDYGCTEDVIASKVDKQN